LGRLLLNAGTRVNRLDRGVPKRILSITPLAGQAAFLRRSMLTGLDAPLLITNSTEAKMSHFSMGWNPFWAWVCSVLDPQDAIKELFNCVL